MSSRILGQAALAAIGVAALVACSHEETARPAAYTTTSSTTRITTVTPPAEGHPHAQAAQGGKGGIRVSAPVRMACNLPDTAAEAPKFDTAAVELGCSDEELLRRVGVCLTTGPLAKKRVCITGYTDPRGTTAYNRDLGYARAYAAMHELASYGVGPEQTTVVTRGEAEAKGKDESQWPMERRVEIGLADASDSPCNTAPTQ
jgi:outer membrane protein OmpA-like peptidoglycan-associated protein